MRREAIGSLHQRSRQRGAAAVLAAISLMAMLAAIALVIDMGRLYVAKQQLQGFADIAALDAARVVSRCNGQSLVSQADLEAAVANSLQRNDAPNAITSAAITRMGVEQVSSKQLRHFAPNSNIDEVDAVQVVLSGPHPGRLLPIFGSHNSTLTAHSAAHHPIEGAVSVGSRLLGLDVADSPLLNPLLGGLLGGSVSLSVASYEALAATMIDLSALAANLGVATTDSLLALELSGPDVLRDLGDAVEDLGNGAGGTASAALYTLAAAAAGGRTVELGEVIDLGEDRSLNAESSFVNTGQLLMAVAQALGSGIPVDLPLSVDIPGLASANAEIIIGQPARVASGPPGLRADGSPRTIARSASATINLDFALLELLGSMARLELNVDVGQSEAWIEEVRCARGGSGPTEARPRGRGQLVALRAPEQDLLNVIGLARIYLDGDSEASGGSTSDSPLFSIFGPFVPQIAPPIPTDHQRSFGDPNLLSTLSSELRTEVLSRVEAEALGFLPIPLGGVLSALLGVLDPLLSSLDLVLTQVFELLGLSVGGGDLAIESIAVQQPTVFQQQPIPDPE